MSPALMPFARPSPIVAFDATIGGIATTNLSMTHTGTAGAAVVLVVNAISGSGITGVTVTYGGVTIPQIASIQAPNCNDLIFIFAKLGAATGTAQTIQINMSLPGYITAACTSYLNVNSFGTAQTINGGPSTTPSMLASSGANQMVAQGFVVYGGGLTTVAGYNQTTRYNNSNPGGGAPYNNATVIGDASGSLAGVSFSATSTTSYGWAGVAMSLIPV